MLGVGRTEAGESLLNGFVQPCGLHYRDQQGHAHRAEHEILCLVKRAETPTFRSKALGLALLGFSLQTV